MIAELLSLPFISTQVHHFGTVIVAVYNTPAAVQVGEGEGQETSGERDHFGQILPFQLPHSRLQGQVSTAHFLAVGGMQDRGGVKPDLEVTQTPEDSSGGIDTALEYALTLTRTAPR